jgi:hypothetical protein
MQVLFYKTMHAFYCEIVHPFICEIVHAFVCEIVHAFVCHPGLDPGSISDPPWILGSSPRMTNPETKMTTSKEIPCLTL